jgi:hypothetical protein
MIEVFEQLPSRAKRASSSGATPASAAITFSATVCWLVRS